MQRINRVFRFEKDKEAEFRLKVIEHHKHFGTKSAVSTYDVSKASIYRWKKRLSKQQGQLTTLIPYSHAPINKRKMMADPKVVGYVKTLRLTTSRGEPKLGEVCPTSGVGRFASQLLNLRIVWYNITDDQGKF